MEVGMAKNLFLNIFGCQLFPAQFFKNVSRILSAKNGKLADGARESQETSGVVTDRSLFHRIAKAFLASRPGLIRCVSKYYKTMNRPHLIECCALVGDPEDMPQFLRRASVKHSSELRCFFTRVEIGFPFGPYLVAKERYGMSRRAAVLMVAW
jgi:hypothetical protein